MLAFDHVLIAVADLGATAGRLYTDHGLTSVAGGRHTGLGTENRIVPLGPDYVELIAVMRDGDPARSALSRWVHALSRGGDRLAALCLRTDELDGWAAALGSAPVAMSRTNEDGSTLSWRLVGLREMLESPPQPMFIEWDAAPEIHPGRARTRHRTRPRGIGWVELSGRVEDMRGLLGSHGLDIRFVDGEPGISAVGISVDGGEAVLRRQPVTGVGWRSE